MPSVPLEGKPGKQHVTIIAVDKRKQARPQTHGDDSWSDVRQIEIVFALSKPPLLL